MSDEEKAGPGKIPSFIDFGLFIAYCLPGIVATFGISFVSPWVSDLLNRLERGSEVTGPAIILAATALSLGLIISAARSVTLEWILYQRLFRIKKTSPDFSKIRTADEKAMFEGIVQNYYRFYQFYGNMFVAGILLSISKYLLTPEPIDWSVPEIGTATYLVAGLVVLLFAARSELDSMNRAIHQFQSIP